MEADAYMKMVNDSGYTTQDFTTEIGEAGTGAEGPDYGQGRTANADGMGNSPMS